MGLRPIQDFKALWSALVDLFEKEPANDPGFEIASSARRFSRRTQAVMDDKLAFTATLMRAGEIDAATRLFAEVEREVLDEEAALFEKVAEVKVAQVARRDRMTRLRLARMLAVALIGSAAMASTALAVSISSFVRGDHQGPATEASGETLSTAPTSAAKGDRLAGPVRPMKVAGVHFVLNDRQMAVYERLTSGDVDPGQLQAFLADILPGPLASKVSEALVAASDTVDKPALQALDLEEATRAARREARSEEPAGEPTEEPVEEEDNEPSPSPSGSGEGDGDGDGEGDGDGDGATGDEEDEDGGDQGLLPLDRS